MAKDDSFSTDDLLSGTYVVTVYDGDVPISLPLEVHVGETGETDLQIVP